MIANLQKATWTDLQALATLANAKLAPAVPYSFPAFAGSDKIALPNDIAPGAVYGAGGFFNPASKVTFRLYGYRTIAGIKYFSFQPRRQAFVGAPGAGSFAMTWMWTNPILNAPDGYIVAIVLPTGSGWQWAWKDVGFTTAFTEDGSFSAGWNFDFSLDAYNEGFPDQSLPCGHGAWLKAFNRIRTEFFAGMDLFGGSKFAFDASFLVSGPWCVSVAPKCYLKLTGKAVYTNLRFIYSPADSATGNQLAPEADMLGVYIGAQNGANNLNWDVNVKINGRIIIFSDPPAQNQADWNVTASHPGITIGFDPNSFLGPVGGPASMTAFIFDCDNVQYTVGTPIVLTVTPLAGGSVYQAGNPAGGGGRVDAVFTGDAVTYAQVDTIAIHPGNGAIAPGVAKAAALLSSLPDITFHATTVGGINALETHHRSFCNGVFSANTLPSPGVMSYLDVDLPQYSPAESFLPASSRRAPRNPDLPFMPTFGNKAALFPVYRDTQFVPDDVDGRPIDGSFAWQQQGTKYATPFVFTDSIPGNNLHYYALFVAAGCADVRFLSRDPNVTLYVKANNFPTVIDHDASVAGNAWLSLKDTLPGFETDTTWFIGVLNPTAGPLTVTTAIVTVVDDAAPTGAFFPIKRGLDGNAAPQLEGFSYHLADPNAFDARPILGFGYCVSMLTIRRQPVANAGGIKISPSAGTADLPVKIGLMKGFSFDAAGVFTEMLTVTIPAGQASVTVPVFWPVLGGTPLAHQCAEVAIVLAAANFQPMMYSTFNPATVKVDGTDQPAGYYGGPVWFSQDAALLFFKDNDPTTPIVLPPHAAVYNDLEAALNLL